MYNDIEMLKRDDEQELMLVEDMTSQDSGKANDANDFFVDVTSRDISPLACGPTCKPH